MLEAEITLAATGGILVMALGSVAFALPFILQWESDESVRGRASIEQLRIACANPSRDASMGLGQCART